MQVLPKVTIGIPTYKQEHLIREAVRSALAQTYSNLEIIIADDNSPDATEKSIQDFRVDPRLRYIRYPANVGRVGNYKKLLYEYASGDWYLNLDGDDYLTDPHFVEVAMRQVLADPEIVLVQAKTYVEDASGNRKEPPGRSDAHMELVAGTEFLLHYPERYRTFHLGALYNRHKAMQLDFYRSDTLRSDSESLLRLALQGKVAYYHRPVGVWRDNGSNETWLLNRERLPKEKAVFDAVAEAAVQKISPALVRHWNRRVKERIDLYFIDSYLRGRSFFRHVPSVLPYLHPRLAFVKVILRHFLHSFKK
jgi:glycosyltransferase involved in cell wall biosynthesis